MGDKRQLAQILRSELTFLEQGAYRRSERYPWRPNFVFEDSSTCINFFYHGHTEPRPCEECPLIEFVPQDHRYARFPCRHINLTERGETVNSFYEYGTQEELEAALGHWLRRTIQQLEAEESTHVQAA